MANSVNLGSLWIDYNVRLDNLNRGMTQVKAEVSSTDKAAQASGKNISASFTHAGSSLLNFGKNAQSAGSSAQSFSNQVHSASSALGSQFTSALRGANSGLLDFASKATIATSGVLSLVQGAARLAGAFFAPNAELEQMQVSFDAFIGDAEQVKNTMADIKKFSTVTPFETPEINAAALSLLNMEVAAKDVTTWMGNIGNAVSKVKGNGDVFKDVTAIVAQMGIEGRITTGELMQLQERNIPSFRVLADAMGISVRQLKDMISANDELIMGADKVQFFVEALGKFGGDAMAEQSKTWIGMWSTVKDTVRDVWIAFSGPAFEKAKGALSSFMTVLSNNQEGIMSFASKAGEKFAGVFDFLGSGFTRISPQLSKLGGAFLDLGGAVFDIWKSISPLGALLDEDVDIFGAIGNIIEKGVTPAIKDFTGFVRELKPIVEPVGTFIRDMFAGAGQWLMDNGPTLQNIGKQIFEGIGTVAKEVGPVVTKELLPAFKDLATEVGPLASRFIDMVDKSQIFKISFGALGLALKGGVHIISEVIKGVGLVLKAFNWWHEQNEKAKKSTSDLWINIQNIFGGIGPWFQARINEVTGAFKWLYDHNKYVRQLVDKIQEFVTEGVAWLKEKWAEGNKNAEAAWKALAGKAGELWDNVSKPFREAWGTHIKPALDGIGANISSTWEGWKASAWNLGRGIIDSIVGGINSVGSSIADTLKGWVQWGLDISGTSLTGWGGGASGSFNGHAEGIMNSPTGHLAIVGERGPEPMWIPKGASVFPDWESLMGTSMSAPTPANYSYPTTTGVAAAAPQPVIHVHVHVTPPESRMYIDSQELARAVGPALAYELRVVA